MYRTFDELIAHTSSVSPKTVRLAVAAAGDSHTLEAVLKARASGIVQPVLVGDKRVILDLLLEEGASVPETDIIDVPDPGEACDKSVELIRTGKASFLMKGLVDTKWYLKAVVNKEHGLAKSPVMSHFSIFQIPAYHKLLAPVDGGMVPYPTLEQKEAIINNTVGIFHKFGYENPKVGVLACVEKVNPKMPETLEAQALKELNQRGDIAGCIVEGPISLDCAVDKEIARLKGFSSEVAGDADILIAPNIHAGNFIGKTLTCFAGAKMAGFVAGAACPVIMTSRGSSMEEKYYSILLAAIATGLER